MGGKSNNEKRKEAEAKGKKKLTKQQEKAGVSKTDKKKAMQAKRAERKGTTNTGMPGK
jgi:hypothetical protein